MTIVSEIKLIRTDTTLDLSQKAEKVCFEATITYLYTFKNIFSRAVVTKPIYKVGFLNSEFAFTKRSM